jgi:hypothetical protein
MNIKWINTFRGNSALYLALQELYCDNGKVEVYNNLIIVSHCARCAKREPEGGRLCLILTPWSEEIQYSRKAEKQH